MTSRPGLLALQEALRSLERNAQAMRRTRGLPSSRNEAARHATGFGDGGRLDSRRISSWLDPEHGQAPRDADQVWALVRTWAQWAGDRDQRRAYWNELVEAAQPVRPQPPVDTSSTTLGRRISELAEDDALTLEVHPAIDADAGPLPPYLPRPHDQSLRDEITAAERGARLVILVGGSSTGKTRACWEAVRHVVPHWKLWHPLTPTRPDAVVAGLAGERLEPRTVVWLNDTWHYLSGTPGEQVASALQEHLQLGTDQPLLVLGSMWPDQWEQLSGANSGQPAAAALLRLARRVVVPAAFTLRQLDGSGSAAIAVTDARLRLAIRLAAGRVTQFLAGAPELEARYRQADECAQAVVHAAVDAGRMGHTEPLPEALLRQAAASCLGQDVWTLLEDNWFVAALTYLTQPCRGVPGILTLHRARPGERPTDGPTYRVADYIDQIVRRERGPVYPPAGFWGACADTVSDEEMLRRLAEEATNRLRYRTAAHLLHTAAQRGNTPAWARLAELSCQRGDYQSAETLAVHAAVDHHAPDALRLVAAASAKAGDTERAVRLYGQAAEHGDTKALVALTQLWMDAGQPEKAEICAQSAAEAGTPSGLTMIARRMAHSGDTRAALRLYRAAAQHGDDEAQAVLTRPPADRAGTDPVALWKAGQPTLAETAAHNAHNPGVALSALAQTAADEGNAEATERFYRAAAAHGNSYALRDLTISLWRLGNRTGAESTAREAAEAGNLYPLRDLADVFRARHRTTAERLYRELAERGDPMATTLLAELNVAHIDPDAAIDAARNGEPAQLRALANRALLTGDYALAEQHYQLLIEDHPGDALLHIASARARAGDLAGAEEAARAATGYREDQALAFVALQAHRLGRHETAERLYRELNDTLGDSSCENIAQFLPAEEADRLRRYGMEPDGQTSPSWSWAHDPQA